MKKVSEFLIGAKKIIQDPANWTQGWFAKNEQGGKVGSNSERAVCFCSLGALERMDGRELPINKYDPLTFEPNLSRFAQDLLEGVMGGVAVEDFNDSHTHEEVMMKWDEAILKAKELES